MIELYPRLFAAAGRIYVVVPMVSMLSKAHLIHPKARSWMRPFRCTGEHISFTKTSPVVHCDK